MKKTLSLGEFRSEVAGYSDDYKHQFSYQGLEALYNYLEEYEESAGEEVEFDLIALCCDFTEYEDLEDLRQQGYDDVNTMEELEQGMMGSVVIPIEGTERFILGN